MLAAVLDGESPEPGIVHHPVTPDFHGILQTCVALLANHVGALGDRALHELHYVRFCLDLIARWVIPFTEIRSEILIPGNLARRYIRERGSVQPIQRKRALAFLAFEVVL